MSRSIYVYSFAFLFLVGCDTNRHTENSTESIPMNKTPSTSKTGILVEKNFVNKNSKVFDFKELYFRASVQDYFIKFCESDVSREVLEPFIDKAITIKGEIIDGLWDDCEDDGEAVQSRTGLYITIQKLID